MATSTISGDLTMADLAASLTVQEQLTFQQVTAISADTNLVLNMVTTVDQTQQLGALSVVPRGQNSPGTKLFSTTIYVSGSKAAADVYRIAS